MKTITPNTLIAAIGGAGCNELSQLIMHGGYAAFDTLVVDQASEAFDQSPARQKLIAHENPVPDPDGYRGEFMRLLYPYDTVLFFAGLGGGMGSALLPVAAGEAQKLGKRVICLVTMPFHFEGAHRQRVAQDALQSLRAMPVDVRLFENQSLFTKTAATASVAEAFHIASAELRGMLEQSLNAA